MIAECGTRIAELVFSGSGDCPAKVERVPVDNVRPRELNVPGHSVQSPRLELPMATMRWRSFRIAELVFSGGAVCEYRPHAAVVAFDERSLNMVIGSCQGPTATFENFKPIPHFRRL